MTPINMQLVWDNHLQNIGELFQYLYNDNSLVDCSLACHDGSFKAHKMVLSACSPYFQQVINDNPCKHPTIIMRGVNYQDLKKLVEYMYKGTVNIPMGSFHELVKLATDLKIKGFEKFKDYQLNLVNKDITIPHKQTRENDSDLSQNSSTQDPSSSNIRETRFKGQKRVIVKHAPDITQQRKILPKKETDQPRVDNPIASFVISEVRGAVSTDMRPEELPTTTIKQEQPDPDEEMEDQDSDNYLYLKDIPDGFDDSKSESSEMSAKDDDEDYLTPADKRREIYPCNICKRRWRTRRDLDKHLKTHQKVYNCEYCRKPFSRTSHLIRHRRTHTGERPFTCDICGKDFARQDKLKLHRKASHFDDLDVSVDLYDVTPNITTEIDSADALKQPEAPKTDSTQEDRQDEELNKMSDEISPEKQQESECNQPEEQLTLKVRNDLSQESPSETRLSDSIESESLLTVKEIKDINEKDDAPEGPVIKKRRGRPRKYPIKPEYKGPKRPRGRPRKETPTLGKSWLETTFSLIPTKKSGKRGRPMKRKIKVSGLGYTSTHMMKQENYDFASLPFGDLNMLTAPLEEEIAATSKSQLLFQKPLQQQVGFDPQIVQTKTIDVSELPKIKSQLLAVAKLPLEENRNLDITATPIDGSAFKTNPLDCLDKSTTIMAIPRLTDVCNLNNEVPEEIEVIPNIDAIAGTSTEKRLFPDDRHNELEVEILPKVPKLSNIEQEETTVTPSLEYIKALGKIGECTISLNDAPNTG